MKIPVSGKVFDHHEIDNAIEAAKDGWWTEGRWAKKFESRFRDYLGLNYVSLVNSGSSANLLAVASLTNKDLEGHLKPGDEFITCAVAFPTTVNPGIQCGLKPVFVDAELDTLNINADKIVITPKTRLIMVAHTLGKPVNMDKIMKIAKKHKLWVIEDCCDALSSRYRGQLVGTFGHIATFSFYPAHHITMGEGGAVVTNNPLIHKSIRQFRDWGRDCWCDPGKDNTCGIRFKRQSGELPFGYDHKYVYSQIGYNLKGTDFGPAIGVAQMDKLDDFTRARKRNYRSLFNFFSQYKHFTLLETEEHEDPSWFGFPMIVNKDAPFTRNELTEYLESKGIGTRNVFSGNLLRHPGYLQYKQEMPVADQIMNQAFWIGVYPGIGEKEIEYITETVKQFLHELI